MRFQDIDKRTLNKNLSDLDQKSNNKKLISHAQNTEILESVISEYIEEMKEKNA